MLVDTHCHLHFKDFDQDREEVIRRSLESGVTKLVNVGTDPETNALAFRLARGREYMRHTAGLHPHSAHEAGEAELQGMESFVEKTKPAAIGEVGLDYYKSAAEPAVQKKVFARMIRLALKHGLPLIVHSREAFADTLEVLRAEGGGKARGVLHCFSYDVSALKKALDLGFHASFACNVTFKNSSILPAALEAPLDRILLETDSPYLAPQIVRGKRNEPAHIRHLAEFLAEKRGLEFSELARRSTENALRLFGWEGGHGR